MATLPVHQPQLPYLGRIPGGLHHGSMIRIKGSMKHAAHRFVINLQCGPNIHPLDDVALHISVRPPEFAVVRNHHEKFRWGTEERGGGCPIRRNLPYEILILAEHTGFKIAIDGTHFCDFRHRLSLSRVDFIHIVGDTDVSYVGMDNEMPPQNEHHHHHHHTPPHHHDPPPHHHIPVIPTAPPSFGILQPYPGVDSRPIYPNLPMPMPMPVPTPPPPPPPYNRPIEANPYPYAPSPYPSPYPVQQPIKVENQYYTNNPNPGYMACDQSSYPTTTYCVPEKKKKHTALKIAAAAGGIGLGAYAISRVLHHSSSDSD